MSSEVAQVQPNLPPALVAPPTSQAGEVSSNNKYKTGLLIGAAIAATVAVVAAIALAALFFPPVVALLPVAIGAGTLALLGIKVGLGTVAAGAAITALVLFILGMRSKKADNDHSLDPSQDPSKGPTATEVQAANLIAEKQAEVNTQNANPSDDGQMQGPKAPPFGSIHLPNAHAAAAAAAGSE